LRDQNNADESDRSGISPAIYEREQIRKVNTLREPFREINLQKDEVIISKYNNEQLNSKERRYTETEEREKYSD